MDPLRYLRRDVELYSYGASSDRSPGQQCVHYFLRVVRSKRKGAFANLPPGHPQPEIPRPSIPHGPTWTDYLIPGRPGEISNRPGTLISEGVVSLGRVGRRGVG